MERRDQQTPDWSNINPDLLECILKKLPLPAVIRCRSVCSKWRSTTKTLLLSPPNPPPMLMLRRKFHNLFGEEDYLGGGGHLFLNLAAPAQEPGSYAGSDEDDLAACVPMGQVTDGWMVSKDRNDRLYMLNPTSFGTVSCLRFPPIEYPGENDHVSERRPEVRIPQKVVFWGNPVLGGECSMAFLCACSSFPPQRLYFAISDGPDFDYRVTLDLLSDSAFIKDIICINNRVYAVTSTGYIEAWDCCGNIRHMTTFSKTTDTTVTTYDAPTRTTTVVKTTDTTTTTTVTTNDAPTLTTTIIKTTDTSTVTTVTSKDAPKLVFSFQPKLDRKPRKRPLADTYLVESEGEVLLVSRNTPDIFESDPRKKFVVYKLDLGLERWMAVDSLGDRVLLMLCRRQNMSLSTAEFPNYERNAIYFVVSGTIYIFNMEDGSVKEAGSERMIMDEEIQYFWTSSSMFDLI